MMLATANRGTFASILLVVFAATSVQAQPTSQGAEQRIVAARDLIASMRLEPMFEVNMKTGMLEAIRIFRQQNALKNVDTEKVINLVLQKLSARKAEFSERLAKLYAETFTPEEMREIAAFYRSPAGSRLIDAQPELMKRSLSISNEIAMQIVKELQTAK
jgi:uncharacterized protein